LHPYTQALISAIPIPDPVKERNRSRIILKGELPTPFQTYSGCVFSSRCPFAQEKCRTSTPSLKEVKPGHLVACHLK
jgi:oligopeptide/dipeptide ABC transporter ATP-binding protein